MNQDEFVGLIPAAGYGTRISPLPFSKELFPIGFTKIRNGSEQKVEVVSANLIHAMVNAGVKNIYMVIRENKWDIPHYYKTGEEFNTNIAYIVTKPTSGTPQTIMKGYPFIRGKIVLFGFPDIYINSIAYFRSIVRKLIETDSDIVLGLFKASNPDKVDMIDLSNSSNVKNIIIKPKSTYLKFTWLIAAWKPAYTKFMYEYIRKAESANFNHKELFVGDIINEAIKKKFKVSSVLFPDQTYFDIGTIDELKECLLFNLE